MQSVTITLGWWVMCSTGSDTLTHLADEVNDDREDFNNGG